MHVLVVADVMAVLARFEFGGEKRPKQLTTKMSSAIVSDNGRAEGGRMSRPTDRSPSTNDVPGVG